MDLYNSKMAEVKNLNTQITALEELERENAMFNDLQNNNLLPGAMLTERNDKEYLDAFFHAVTNGYTVKSGRNVEQLKPLYNALSETGVPPGRRLLFCKSLNIAFSRSNSSNAVI